MCAIKTCLDEGEQAYYHLKKFFSEPERANIDIGHYTRCNKDAWWRGFRKAMWNDSERFVFLKRIVQ